MNPRIRLDEMVTGLEHFRGEFDALDVFADDVEELQNPFPVAGLVDLGGRPRKFALHRGGKRYLLTLFEDQGVLRLEFATEENGSAPTAIVLAGLAGAAIGAAATKKGAGAELGLLLGLLVGVLATKQRSSFTMRFDPSSRTWKAYTGGLTNWMRRELATPL